MALIEIEIEDHLDEVDNNSLVEELKRRKLGFEIATGRQIAERLRRAYYRCDASQFEAILVAHLDPFEIKQEKAA